MAGIGKLFGFGDKSGSQVQQFRAQRDANRQANESAKLRAETEKNKRLIRAQRVLAIKATSRVNVGGLRDKPKEGIRSTIG